MSADSDITTLILHATAAASSLSDNAATLVDQAVVALEGDVEFPDPPSFIPVNYGVSLPIGTIPVEPPAAFPTLPVIDLGTPPNTQELDEVYLDVDNREFPTLTFPTFLYPKVAGVPKFTKTVPNAGTDAEFPTAPDGDALFEPLFLGLTTIDPVTLSIEAPTFAPIDTTVGFDPIVYATALGQFQRSIFGGNAGLPGLDTLLAELSVWARNTLDAVLPAALEVLSVRMSNKQAAVLSFQTELRSRLTDRLATEKTRVVDTLSDRSGWDLPHAVQVARRAAVDQLADAWVAHAESQADTQTAELALAFFEACGNLLTSFTTGVQKLKAQEITLVLEAHKNAIAYAKAVLAALLAQYEATNFLAQDVEFQKAEAQLKVFESELTIALLQYEVARANLEVESAQQDADASRIQTLKAEVAQSQNAVRRYAALVGEARKEVVFRQFSVERFELLVKAYDAQINAHEARVNAQIAEIEGDTARVTGQLKKLEGFESQMQGFLQLIETKQLRANAQSTRNEAVIDEFSQRVKAALAEIDQSVIENAHALKQYEVQINDLIANAKLAQAVSRQELDFRNKQLDGEMEAHRFTQERGMKLMEVELARLRAIAEVNSQGANIMAEMAQGAMSAANGIAAAIYSETA